MWMRNGWEIGLGKWGTGNRGGEGKGQISNWSRNHHLLALQYVEAPIDSVEEDEGERKHHPRILVDDVHVLDGGYGALDGRGALFNGRYDPLPVRGAGGVDARAGWEGVVAIDAERGREFEVLR